jgi:hypothetical protein
MNVTIKMADYIPDENSIKAIIRFHSMHLGTKI